MKIFAIVNMKGGVGKTTTAVNLAYLLAVEYGRRVLLVDADAQANATQLLLPPREYEGLAALLEGGTDGWSELIQPTEIDGLDMLPASEALWSLDMRCITSNASRVFDGLFELCLALEKSDAYDMMVIDCPPNYSAACIAALRVARTVIIPVLADRYSAQGMAGLSGQLSGILEVNPRLRVGGVLINQYHNTSVVLDAVKYIRESAPVHVYATVIRRTDKVMESTWARQPVLMWSPFSSAARDYRDWVRELAGQEGICRGEI